MFRDSRGVVHTVCSADPLADLPIDAAAALQQALLIPVAGDLGGALERCDAARDLLERWQDAFFASLPQQIDLAEEGEWAARAGMSLTELDAAYEEQEDDDPGGELGPIDADAEDLSELLLDSDEEDPRAVLPERLVAVLERELLLLPVRTRLEALVAAADLVSTWSDLLADHEKLVGHLVLRHDLRSEPTRTSRHDELADDHARAHEQTGPEHRPLAQ